MVYKPQITQEQERAFRTALERTTSSATLNHVGYIGLVGSENSAQKYSHDIDVLIVPKRSSPIGESLIEMDEFYAELDSRLMVDHGIIMAPAARKIMQAEVHHIISEMHDRTKVVNTHTLFFPDFESYDRINPAGFVETVEMQRQDIFGSLNDLITQAPITHHDIDGYMILADYQIPLVANKFPEHLVLVKSEELVDYMRQWFGIDVPIARSSQEAVETSQSLLRQLDSLCY